jgi:hypothetical protein
MNFSIFQPCNALKPFIKSFAIDQRGKASDYRVLPDTSIIIGFQYSGKLSYIDKGKSISLGSA